MAGTEYVVKATDAASRVFEQIGVSAEHLDQQLHDLSDRVATPEVDLKDAKFTAGIIRAAERIDKLSAMVADPQVEVDGAAAQKEILRITAQLDRLAAKKVTVDVNVDVNRAGALAGRLFGLKSAAAGAAGAGGGGLGGLFGRIFGFGAAAGGGGAQSAAAGNSFIASLGPYAQGGIYGVLGALAASLGPSLLPVGLGLGVGGAGILGAFKAGSSANKQLTQLQTQLANAKGKQKAALQQQVAQLQTQYSGVLGFYNAAQGVFGVGKETFLGALSSTGRGFSGAGPNQSFLTSVEGILKQIQGFIKSIGPQLGDLFRASVPYLQLFVHFLEQAAKVLLPVFTQMLQQMTPYLPLMAKGLMNIVNGLAGFLKAIGPSGMQASAKIFVVLTKIMEGVLIGLGVAIEWLTEHIPVLAHSIAVRWDRLRRDMADTGHAIAAGFDWLRHYIAAVWDKTFQELIGRQIRGAHDIEAEWNTWRHNTAVIFDTVRHDIAHSWDLIYNNTIGVVIRMIHDVTGWFHRLPGMVIGALTGLGHSLGSFASAAFNEMWDGFKRVGGEIVHWVESFAHGIVGVFKKIWGIFSPSSVFRDLGENMMHGLAQGIRGKAHVAQSAISSVGRGLGGGVQQWAPLVTQALRMEGLSPGLLHNVLYQMQTESGGRVNAINLSDINAQMGTPSKGLMQVIQPTFDSYHWPGTSWNIYNPLANIAAALNYARHRYGPSLMSGGMGIGSGHGYAYGTLSAAPGWALVGERGPEMVRFRGGERVYPGAGGNTYIIHQHIPVGVNKAEVGRVTVEAIREYEKRSGSGWRR